jgi:hypothetical protein
VSLSSSSTGTKIFAATSGGTSISTITIPAGTSSVSFYYGDSLAGTPQISASRTGFSTGRQTQTITAAAPSRFAFTSAPVTGSASLVPTLGPLTVRLTDTFGNTAVATSSTAATMASSSTGTKRFSLSASGTPTTTSLIFAIGSSSASFYYSDSRAGTPTITISRSGYTSATQVQTILSTVATKLAITSTAITLAAPSTTASRGPFTVQLQDSTSNPVLATTGGRTVTLSSSSTSTTKVFSAALSGTPTTTVTIPAGASSTTFYYGDTKAGSATISVSSSGLTTGTQSTTTAAGPVAQLAITSTAITGAASATAARGPFTVRSRDQYGNASVAPVGGLVISLSTSSTGATVFAATASGTPTTSVTIAAATSSVSFYYGDTTAGTAAITASSPGLTSASQNATITGATASAVVFSTAPVTGAASSTAARGPYTAQLRDVFGNVAVAPSGGKIISLSSNSTGTKIFSATANGAAVTTRTIPAAASAVSFYYGDTRVGTPTITLTATGLTGASQITTITPAAATVLAVTSTALSGAASATASLGPITVQLRDAFGNTAVAPVAGNTLTLASTSTGSKVFSASLGGPPITTVTIAPGGSSAIVYYGDTKVGTPTITVSGTGLTSATRTATITAGAPVALAFTTAALSGAASSNATLGPLSVQLRDAHGNAAAAPTGGVTIIPTSTSPGTTVFSTSSGGVPIATVTVSAGLSSASFYYGDTTAGTPMITAAAGGLTSATQNQTVVAAAVSQLLITSAPLSGSASSTASLGPVTVQAKDQFGNLAIAPAGGTAVTLSSSSAGTKIFAASLSGTSVTTVTIPVGTSSTTFYYGDTRAGTPTITVSRAGVTSASQPVTVLPAVAAKLVFGQQPTSTVRGATLSPAVTARILDQFNNLTTSTAPVTITIATNPVGGTLNGTKVVSAVAGVATFSTLNITAPAAGTGYTLQISATGLTGATSSGFTIS